MDNSMQDIISRYSRELLEYGRQYGTAGTVTQPLPTQEQKLKRSKEHTYAPPKQQKTSAAAPDATVLYEDFHEAGVIPNSASGRIVFAAGESSLREIQTQAAVPAQKEPAVQAEIPKAEDAQLESPGAVKPQYVQAAPQPKSVPAHNVPAGGIIHEGQGWLKVQVFQSEARYPLEGARVVVFRSVNGKHYAIHDRTTDSNGMTGAMVLPAPRKEFSLSPRGMAGKHAMPYASYNLYVEHPSFLREIFPEISLFDGVDSIKPVILTPKAVGATERMPSLDFYA